MSLDSDRIEESIKTLGIEGENIDSQVHDIALNSYGGVTLDNAKSLSFLERNALMTKINQKIEARSGKEWL